MIRRPLNERFSEKVLAGIKTTTIRGNPWPVGKPIMLFRWSGKPYRSKQINIAPVVVKETYPIRIEHEVDGRMVYSRYQLWMTEGFESKEDMDSWFRPLVRRGSHAIKHLMVFRLWTCGDNDRYFETHGKMP